MARRSTPAVVLDVSTYPASLAFRLCPDRDTRLQLAPRMMAACLYDSCNRTYRGFLPAQVGDLIQCLERAERLVTFNGFKYDLVVLERHHDLSKDIATRPSHVDLAKIIEDFTGQWPSFDDIVWRNLKERKKSINDFTHDPVNRTDAIAACKSDVRQTYKLFRLYEASKFIYPAGLGAQSGSRGCLAPSPGRGQSKNS